MFGEWLFTPALALLKLRLESADAIKRGFDKAMQHKRSKT